MGDFQPDLAREEYAALRATIRERSTVRVVLFVTILGLWGALVVATVAAITLPVAALIPLIVLAGGFEGIASLHIGVERVGRYVQVQFERDTAESAEPPAAWERTSMAWGRRFPRTGTDPLFTASFFAATAVNYLPVALTGEPSELLLLAVAHFAVVWRIVRVRAWAARQRTEDLERFRAILATQDKRHPQNT
jgi:hypothetical protein